jgi:hypothetical protein
MRAKESERERKRTKESKRRRWDKGRERDGQIVPIFDKERPNTQNDASLTCEGKGKRERVEEQGREREEPARL